ncbi:GNAT family N-acetyltransferase [Leptolyngbya sp. FACHB-711]|uniref:GNAT family N-acetyltransferase n=1 Tax=unclassified Leptolyngbya TaxID=2650499 RepID=UPI001684931B|nr:GNAT family N-acetyltransferase [Leptolyngbya sp. FACHB-711]MBD1852570.1 GNAT family N-acetyltransferase [Cyanobacteria bacterium FACHB-502]MBD2024531.1 GNAT family N-acetyltransferase [Leptolyngbya sp. FACHB-711]
MKTEIRTIFRSAIRDDCNTIAQLFRISSEGVSDYVWSTLADDYPGLTPIEIGAKRYANEESLFSYKNCVLAQQAGEIAGMMLTFPIEDSKEATSGHAAPQEIPLALTPEVVEAPGTWHAGHHVLFTNLQQTRIVETQIEQPTSILFEPSEPDVLDPYNLEAPGTWYICALALFPEFRGQGIGTQFLSIAHQQAAARGFSELSLLCFEQNTRALNLYQRNGFKVINFNPVVPHPLIHHTGDILLMTAPVQF